jgi:hypothetical protein
MTTSGVNPGSTATEQAPGPERPLPRATGRRRIAFAFALVSLALAALTACWPPAGGPGSHPQGKPGIGTAIVWGDCPGGSHHCPLLTITSTGTAPLKITAVDAPPAPLFEGILTNGCIGTFAPGQSCEVQFGQTIGSGSAVISDNVPPGTQTVTFSV